MSDPSTAQPAIVQNEKSYQVTDNTLRHRSQELGLMGKVFGSKENAPVNIAGAIIVLGLISMLVVPFVPSSPSLSQGDLEKTLAGLIVSAFTFLGGYLGGNKDKRD